MKPSDCVSGKWYYFKWLFHSQPVYFKYNMTIFSNILVGRCSIWKTVYTHGGAYREDEIEDLVEVDPSISDIQSRLPVDHPDKIVPLPVASLPIESLPDPKPIGPSLGITDLVAGEWYKFRFNRNLVYARLYELSGDIYFVTTELIYLGCYSRRRYSFSVCDIKSIELADMKDPIFEKHLPKYFRWYIKYPSYTRDVKFRKDVDSWIESKGNTYSNLKPGDYYVKYNGLLCTQIVESGLEELSRDDFYRYILHKPVPPIKSASFSPIPGSEDILDCIHSNPSISPVEIDRMPCGTSSKESQKKVIPGGVSNNITIKKTIKTRLILVESIKNIKP